MDASHFLSRSQRDPRIARILLAALGSVEPGLLVSKHLQSIPLPRYKRAYLLGIGKAAEPMVRAAARELGHISSALIVTKQIVHPSSYPPEFTLLEAGHPIPDARSLVAGRAVLEYVSGLDQEDLLICLISGGGSALVSAPMEGISLNDLQAITTSLLNSGAGIDEINILRRKLDLIKGGGLAASTNAAIFSLILSDVIGDRLEVISSGPTVFDSTTCADALEILGKYNISIPESIRSALKLQRPPVQIANGNRVQNTIIGNNQLALNAAEQQANREGFAAEIIEVDIHGEAREAGMTLADRLRTTGLVRSRPFCLIGGGETTVTMENHGKGGRNQELALAAVDMLDGGQDLMLIALATDGNDGPTDAAGAIATGETRQRAAQLGMSASAYLAGHDSYSFFAALGDLLLPGYTGTNVNDLILLCGL